MEAAFIFAVLPVEASPTRSFVRRPNILLLGYLSGSSGSHLHHQFKG